MHSEYSKRTVILSFSEKSSEEDAKKLAEKMNLELLYFYSNFNMCALSAKKDLSDEEMSALLETLEAERLILEKDLANEYNKEDRDPDIIAEL